MWHFAPQFGIAIANYLSLGALAANRSKLAHSCDLRNRTEQSQSEAQCASLSVMVDASCIMQGLCASSYEGFKHHVCVIHSV